VERQEEAYQVADSVEEMVSKRKRQGELSSNENGRVKFEGLNGINVRSGLSSHCGISQGATIYA